MAKAKQFSEDDDALLKELGVDTSQEVEGSTSPREQRIIAGFEEITRFVTEHRRLPELSENRDIFERIYAVRLESIRKSPECREVLKNLDTSGLLKGDAIVETMELDDDDLLIALGATNSPGGSITNLVHVRSQEEIQAAEEIAQRSSCKDFGKFKPVFEAIQQGLELGEKSTVKYRDDAEVVKGDLFILDGQKTLVAELSNWFTPTHGRPDRRLRVIYDNGTESDLLLRSLQRALNKDKGSRRIISGRQYQIIFGNKEEEGDTQTGHIYILRSKSDHPFITKHRDVIHKIGVTSGDIQVRIANAKKDPTFLLADVEIVASFKLVNIKRIALEKILHKFFDEARLDMELKDRFGIGVEPREWFLVPLPVIEDMVEKIMNGTISQYRYDQKIAKIIKR